MFFHTGVDLPSKAVDHSPKKTAANQLALQVAMKPIHGAEFDLDEASIETAILPKTAVTPPSYPEESNTGEDEFQEVKKQLEFDQVDSAVPCTKIVRKYPSLIFPTGALQKKSHAFIYTSLFKMAWGGEEDKARSVMMRLRKSCEVSVDLKIVSMEVVHTVNTDRDLKVLTSALAYTDRNECENRFILKCRLHRRIAGLHYRNDDLDEANDHMETALQLAEQIGPDIDTIYTWRLKALMLFEDYKKTRNRKCYKDANKFFSKAMDHAKQQPESKRVVTERVKVSKALFHLDMWEECQQQQKEQEILEELEMRARDTLDDVEEDYLTDGDRAFLYLTRAKLLVICQDWAEAKSEAEKSLTINKKCGFDKRARDAQNLLEQLEI